MNTTITSFQQQRVQTPRSPRYSPVDHAVFLAQIDEQMMKIHDFSSSGLGCKITSHRLPVLPGTRIPSLRVALQNNDTDWDCGPARVVRVEGPADVGIEGEYFLGLAFERDQSEFIEKMTASLRQRATKSARQAVVAVPSEPPPSIATLDQFADFPHQDILAKCDNFQSWMSTMRSQELWQRFYRLKVKGPIDHKIQVEDYRGGHRTLTCFDSNSYLGLHRHPLVLEEVVRVTREVGYGTPSAQLLCGTNDYLVELEDSLARFHGRSDAMVFPTGFAANAGILRALLRSGDAVFRDQHAHASIHEGCRKSGAERNKVFAHNDMSYLERLLAHADRSDINGKLVVTDGVFSMHGELAPVPELAALCRKYRARLMVDDAHGVGVLGKTGHGIEEHFNCQGTVDVLMGTLSKTLGALGGYVVGDRSLIEYLRVYAPSGFFTTTLPAPLCAGVTKALEIIESEPEHAQRLWENVRRFVPGLRDAGFKVSGMASPIVTVFVGKQDTMWKVSRDLYEAGIKAGNVIYPAVPRDGCILRFTINAQHTAAEIEHAVEQLVRIGRRHGVIGMHCA